MRPARPTLRCLRDDLKLQVPHTNEPLDEIAHPLLTKATEQFADTAGARDRIRAIDDQLLFKVKVQRWRGAVWTELELPWLVAAGKRESGSPDDFYEALAREGVAARRRYNSQHSPSLATKTYTGHLLPDQEDANRFRAEAGARLLRQIKTIVHDLLRASLRDGREHSVTMTTHTLGIQVRADDGHLT